MGDIKIGNGSISIFGIIAAVGGLLAFIALFLAITRFDATSGAITIKGVNISGLDMLTNKVDGHKVEDYFTFWKIMPLLTAIMGLATLVLALLPIFGVKNPGVQIAFMVCGILTFVFGLLVFICSAGTPVLDTDSTKYIKPVRQIGAYFALIGGLIAGGCAAADKFVKL